MEVSVLVYFSKYNSVFTLMIIFGLLLNVNFTHAKELQVGSWGGNLRSGPGTNYTKIGSLGNGDPVVLLEKIKATNNDYPWFKIKQSDGLTGYQWGGILCGYGRKISGTFGICEKDNRSTPRIFDCNQQNSIRPLANKRDTKITFFVGQTQKQFEIYWINYEGEKRLYKIIKAGTSMTVNTHPSHPWLILSVSPNGFKSCHSLIKGKKKNSQWLLR